MGTRFSWAVAVTAGILFAAAARAQTPYSYYYIAGQTSYSVAPGATVSVPIYLEEVNSDGSNTSFLSSANEDGLYAGAFQVGLSSSTGGDAATITNVSANYSLTGAPGAFDNVTDQSFTTGSAAVQESLGVDLDGVAENQQGNGVSTVYLGNLTIQASQTPGQATTFTVGVYDPSNGNTLTYNNNFDLDNNQDNGDFESVDPSDPLLYYSAASNNFTITASTPEPVSCSIVAMSGAALLLRRRKTLNG